jgi:hypothetical protein
MPNEEVISPVPVLFLRKSKNPREETGMGLSTLTIRWTER